uniref:Uncharacterized protein n=1 Tax=Anguilla anguilla TaxID=7936 RepID=A0A0E9UHV0_ANGAN
MLSFKLCVPQIHTAQPYVSLPSGSHGNTLGYTSIEALPCLLVMAQLEASQTTNEV